MKRGFFRTVLGVLLAASVTACLSIGIASATKTAVERSHSCCPDSSSQPDQPAPPAKTTAGVPSCCLVLLQGKVAHAVLFTLGFQAVAVSPTLYSPALASARAVIPVPDLLLRYLTETALSIRAPPLS